MRTVVTRDATPPTIGRAELNPPSPLEVRQLFEVAASPAIVKRWPWWPAWLRLAAATGARRSEVLGARWEDFGAGEWRIGRIVAVGRGGDVVSADAKTRESIRTIALDRTTVLELERWRIELGVASGWCWPSGRRDAPLSRATVDQAWWATRAAAELGRHVRLHDLRHAHATTLLSEGFDVRTVAGRLGHSTATLLAVYASWVPARDTAAADRMGELLED